MPSSWACGSAGPGLPLRLDGIDCGRSAIKNRRRLQYAAATGHSGNLRVDTTGVGQAERPTPTALSEVREHPRREFLRICTLQVMPRIEAMDVRHEDSLPLQRRVDVELRGASHGHR